MQQQNYAKPPESHQHDAYPLGEGSIDQNSLQNPNFTQNLPNQSQTNTTRAAFLVGILLAFSIESLIEQPVFLI